MFYSINISIIVKKNIMGSFYATCSITQQTIIDGQEMYMQFMLPSIRADKSQSSANIIDSFLKTAKRKGLEKALESYSEITKNWDVKNEFSSKGLLLDDDNSKWVPFGPAIRGVYDDYGNIAPSDDEDSQNRVKILESLMGSLPFSTIMDVAQDDRWYTLGLGEYKHEQDSNKNWRPEGITIDMPEWLLDLCKKMSITYFHASVYDEMINENFSPSNLGGIADKYDKKYREEYINEIKKTLPLVLGGIKDFSQSKTTEIDLYMLTSKCRLFANLKDTLLVTYLSSLVREETPLDFIYETINFMYSLGTMRLILEQSKYGSQYINWFGWKRIHNSLIPSIEKQIKEMGYEEDNEDE